MRGKQRDDLMQLGHDQIFTAGLSPAMKTKSSGPLTLIKYTLVGVAKTNMHGSYSHTTHYYLSDLVNKYENISFTKFAEYVIEEATRYNCFDKSFACSVNEHFRQVFAQ